MLSRRVWITGGNSFTGKILRQYFASHDWDVTSLVRGPAEQPFEKPFDLLDPSRLNDLFESANVDLVVHLAGISFVGHADQADFYKVNTIGTENLLKALAKRASPPRTLIASSANVYGQPSALPCVETTPLNPLNHYAMSKLGMERVTNWFKDKIPIILTRPFNYTGAGQRQEFLVPKIVNAFRNREETIELGNLDVSRDFLDVRDVAQAYMTLALSGEPGHVYNIANGSPISLGSIIDRLKKLTGHPIEIKQNPEFIRENEIKELFGSNAKLSALGWKPNHPFEQTLEWMLE